MKTVDYEIVPGGFFLLSWFRVKRTVEGEKPTYIPYAFKTKAEAEDAIKAAIASDIALYMSKKGP
jgi:hypothetical protein